MYVRLLFEGFLNLALLQRGMNSLGKSGYCISRNLEFIQVMYYSKDNKIKKFKTG